MGNEGLQKQLLDAQEGEPSLPQLEVGKRAYQLIQDFERALKLTPEFTEALQNQYFANAQLGPRIVFEKGVYRYSIRYRTGHDEEELNITKVPLNKDNSDWWLESMSLEVVVNRFKEIVGGGMQHAIFYKDFEEDHPTNTLIAFQRVQDFLATNFVNN